MVNHCNIAFWDNRSVYTPTNDYDGFGEEREGHWPSLGERPYRDPNSKVRRQALGLDG